MKWIGKTFVVFILVLSACIRTDNIDDPLVGALIMIDPVESAMLVGQQQTANARYFDDYGVETEVDFTWHSDDPGVEVDENGVLTAVSEGQANIHASYGETVSPSFLITVVGSVDDVAKVYISASRNQISVGDSLKLNFQAYDFDNKLVPNDSLSSIQWFSSKPSILSIDNEGLVIGHEVGVAEVHVVADSISSSKVMLSVGNDSRTGTFQGNGGYTAEGTALLKRDEIDNLVLEFSSDFKTSFALGTFIYLSNSTGGGATATGGLEIAEITTNGAKTFNVSAIDSTVELSTYKYVIVLCKPASVTFGWAELVP